MVSAILTTYKRPPEIVKRAAESILNQTYKDLELIIVDDSPDSYELRSDVKKMTETLKGNVSYIQHEENQGACAARNTGIKASKGAFIAFLDDDDEWMPAKIEKQLSKFDNDEIALVYCGRYIVDEKNKSFYIGKVKFLKGLVFDKLIVGNFIGSTSYPLIRRSVFDDVGMFDVHMKAAQDYEMWLRIARKHRVDYVTEPLVRYHVHDGEQITKNHRGKAESLERLNELHMDYLAKHPVILACKLMRIASLTAEFDVKKARRLISKSLGLYPWISLELLRAVKKSCIMPILKK